MSFKTLRNNTALKQWDTDSCSGKFSSPKTLVIEGKFPTGRTDQIKYQRMVITINNFKGPDTYTGGLTQTYFEDLFGSTIKKTVTKAGSVTVSAFDMNTGLLSGTFYFLMESYPPNLDAFKTAVSEGSFSAKFENELVVSVAPGKSPFNTNANTKVKYKAKVTDLFGNLVENAEVNYTDEINKKTNEKLGLTNSSGEIIYELEIAEATKTADYELSFSAKKSPYKPSALVKKTVSVSARYWVYKCAGIPLLTFDAGQGNEWKKENDDSPIISNKGTSVINDLLSLKGEVKIDPTAGQEFMDGKYDVSIEGLNLGGAQQVVDLIAGKSLNYALTCETKFKLKSPELLSKKIGGVEINLEEFRFQDEGFGTSLILKGKAKFENFAKESCQKGSNTPEASTIEVGLSVVKEELGGLSLGSCSFAATNLATVKFPQFCVNNLALEYNAIKDAWKIGGACEFNVSKGGKKAWEGAIKGSLGVEKGKFESFSFEGSTDIGIPVPQVPLFMWNGLKLNTSGWASDEWKAQSADIAGVFTSIDAKFFEKVPRLKDVLGEIAICEIELGAKLTYPFIIEGGAKLSLFKLEAVSKTKPWQIEGSYKASMDFVTGLNGESKYVKAFHFGAEDYVVNIGSEEKSSVVWEDRFEFSTSAVALFRIPDMPTDGADGLLTDILKYAKGKNFLPHDLGHAGVYLRSNEKDGIKATGVIDLQQNPNPFFRSLGRSSLEIGINKKPYVKFSGLDGKIAFIAKQSDGNGIQSLKEPVRNSIAASTVDSFRVSVGLERVFVSVRSLTKAPASTLVSPTGERITATNKDSSIILFKSTDNQLNFWVIIKPALGIWKIETLNPVATDSVFIQGLPEVDKRPFSIAASATGRTLKVVWDNSIYHEGDRIDLFLNAKNSGSGGVQIGFADATIGEYTYTFSDALPFCSCYLYGIRVVDGLTNDQAYVATEFNTGRTSTPAPTGISVTITNKRKADVKWVPVTSADILQYGIYVKTPEGSDSLISSVDPDLGSTYIECDTSLIRSLFMVSFDMNGHRGCPRGVELVTVGVENTENYHTSMGATISVSPQPAHDILYFLAPASLTGAYTCELFDLMGNRVAYEEMTSSVSGSRMLSVSGLCSGCYLLRLSNDRIRTQTLVTVFH